MKDKFMQEVSTFESKGYILNTDNFKKILFILQKAKMRVPIVLLGESGCGKTYMIKFIAKVLLQGAFKAITIHAGYSHQQLLSELKEICIEGKKVLQENQWGRIWVFFDELNTSPLQDLIAEIMIDRYCSFFDDPWIPKSVVFVAAGNPYRIKKRD
jgi:MoxR-like ATPase